MMLTLEEIKKTIAEMPGSTTGKEVIDRLNYLNSLVEANTSIDKGKGRSHEEVMKRFTEKWLTK
ncbi:hypothetical protein [Jiulongibacter sediminis]|jgi:hypothetical protein|uniref:hypothetical protein n=1 Tax=Jiulongibacter sediminis TaxID=1605367 RepID=UPI0026F1DF82|nr:hypothetical protein [Jiulongibacter sediminis]